VTDLEKENAYGVAWIIYDKQSGIPDTAPSMYQRKPTVRQGTIADLEAHMENVFQDFPESAIYDPMRGLSWYALKVSKEGKAIYGDYSVPLCTKVLCSRWNEKDLLMAKAHQLEVIFQDKKYDALLNDDYFIKDETFRELINSLWAEWKMLYQQALGLTKALLDMGVRPDDQIVYNSKH
jgi:hypothetical protein